MDGKITWSDIYSDFKHHYPRMSKSAIHYQPSDYLKILVTFQDGMKMLYDYNCSSGKYVLPI